MFGIADAIAQVARIFANKTDGNNMQTLKTVKRYKDTDKAMEASEKHMFSVASFIDGKITLKQMTYLHRKYFDRFFKYN